MLQATKSWDKSGDEANCSIGTALGMGQGTFYGVVKGLRHFLWRGEGAKALFMAWSRGQRAFLGVVKGQLNGQKILTLVAGLSTAHK